MYLCFIDASKAFDRINYWHLCTKLLNRGLPLLVVRMFVFWFTMQSFVVKWSNIYSAPFNSSNGLRQGGILSPIYFNVFIDDLSIRLSKSGVGCYVNNTCFNHLFYADDSVLLAPSPSALQTLISICELYAKENELVFNEQKTVCMSVLPRSMKNIHVPDMFVNDKKLRRLEEQKNIHYI